MAQRKVTVGSKVGLHARPAALVAEAAGKYDDEILLSVDGDEPIDASSSMMIMTLGAQHGTEVLVESDDPAAVEEIASLIAQDLDALVDLRLFRPLRAPSAPIRSGLFHACG